MQGAVASSGWESTRSRLAVTWQGCPARQPGLLAAFPWPSQAHPFMDVPWQGESCVLAHDLYNPGPSRRVCGQGQEGLTVRGHSSSQAVCPAPSLPPPPCWICSCPPRLPDGGAAAACGGCLRWVPAVGACGVPAARLFCVSLCKRSRALGVRFAVTAHPMSDPLQILTANSYANYLISCLIYFLWHHVFSTSPRPGGCGFPGLGGGRSRAAARGTAWAEPSSAGGSGAGIPRSHPPRCGMSGTRNSWLLK